MRLLIALFVLVIAGCETQPEILAGRTLSGQEMDSVLFQLVIRTDRPAPGGNNANRDSAVFVDHFKKRMAKHRLVNFYTAGSITYAQFYRVVPSLYREQCAIAVSYVTDSAGNISAFEELYVTPKLKPGELDRISQLLFTELVSKGNIQQYQRDRTMVEFPDSITRYSREEKRWISELEKKLGV